MKREQKMGMLGLTLVGFMLVSPFFQNCAKTNYDLLNASASTVVGGTGSPSSRKVVIDPTYNQVKANLKVLFVVDDSYTMSQSQTQLANAVDSLLGPLYGHNVDLRIVSTSGVPSNEVDYDISTNYMTESRLSVSQAQAQTLPTYLVERKIANNQGHKPNLKLFRSSTVSQFNQLKLDIKNAILAVGVNGSDTEEGICATARQLFDESANRFFKPGDKAAIVLLTDENDASAFSSCVSRYIQRVSSQPVVYYSYGQQRARVSLEYQLTRDGVTDWYPVQWGISLVGPATITNGATCSVTDQNMAVNKITSQGYVIRNVSACVYETVPVSYYGSDLGDNGTNPALNLCTSTVTFNNASYANLYALVHAINLSAQTGSCSKQVLPGNVASASIEYDSVIASDVSAANMQNLNYAIRNRSISLFGNSGFLVAGLIRQVGESCPLNAGQSFGVSYETLAQLLGTGNAVTQSLCAASFSSTLSQVSTFIVDEANTSYVVTSLQSTEKITSVTVIRSNQRTTLSSAQYELVGATITMTNFTLQTGDIIEIQIDPL